MRAHWGAHKTYLALRNQGSKASWRMVKKVCEMCEVCAKFRQDQAHAKYGQPLFSLEPGHTIFADVVGPLVRGRGGIQHIHCLVDSATRMGDAMKFRVVNTGSVIRALRRWISKYGKPIVLMTDNAAYHTSVEMVE